MPASYKESSDDGVAGERRGDQPDDVAPADCRRIAWLCAAGACHLAAILIAIGLIATFAVPIVLSAGRSKESIVERSVPRETAVYEQILRAVRSVDAPNPSDFLLMIHLPGTNPRFSTQLNAMPGDKMRNGFARPIGTRESAQEFDDFFPSEISEGPPPEPKTKLTVIARSDHTITVFGLNGYEIATWFDDSDLALEFDTTPNGLGRRLVPVGQADETGGRLQFDLPVSDLIGQFPSESRFIINFDDSYLAASALGFYADPMTATATWAYPVWLSWLSLSVAGTICAFQRRPSDALVPQPKETESPERWLKDYLPIVRVQRRALRRHIDVVVIAEKHVRLCSLNRNEDLSQAYYSRRQDEFRRHLNGRGTITDLSYDDIQHVAIEEPAVRNTRYRITTTDGDFRFTVPTHNADNVTHALLLKLGRRVSRAPSIGFQTTWAKLAAIFLLSLLVPVGMRGVASSVTRAAASVTALEVAANASKLEATIDNDATRVHGAQPSEASAILELARTFASIIVYSPLLLLGVTATPLLMTNEFLHHLSLAPASSSREVKITATGEDVSGRAPYRSRRLGKFLRICGVLCALWGFAMARGIAQGQRGYWIGIGLMVLATNVLLRFGQVLSLDKTAYVRSNDRRAPILYLRSFTDDGKNSLNPGTYLSSLLGIEAPFYLISPLQAWPVYGFLRACLYYVSNNHPVRLLHLALNRFQETAEEQLAFKMNQHGPFVAIGRPGEKFATPGASRMYVNHSEWQQVVIALLKQSDRVVLQPSSTEGVWWEVRETLRRIPPRRLLLCLVNYHRRQNDFEKFRVRLHAQHGVRLPRWIGNNPEPCFIMFDENWYPRELKLSYTSPFRWPVDGRTPDLDYTLAPFMTSDASTYRSVGRSDVKQYPGHGFAAACLYTGCVFPAVTLMVVTASSMLFGLAMFIVALVKFMVWMTS